MRTATAVLLIWAALAAAQAPVVVPPPEPAGSPLTVAETILTPGPGMAVGQQHLFGAQLQFGRPTGLRLQYAVHQGGDFSILAEVFGGARDAFWGDEAIVGVAGRAMFNLLSDGVNDALAVSPGLGISYWQARPRPAYAPVPYTYYDPYSGGFVAGPVAPAPKFETDRYFLTLDMNIGWLHDLSPSLGWEVGLNFGVRIGVSGEEDGGESVSGKVSGGNVGVYTGFRY